MTERQMEMLEIVAVVVFIAIIALAVAWGNNIGIERMGQ